MTTATPTATVEERVLERAQPMLDDASPFGEWNAAER